VRDWFRGPHGSGLAWEPVGAGTQDPMALRGQSRVGAHQVTVPCASVMIRAYTEKRWDQVLTTADSIRNQGMGRAVPFRCDVCDLVVGTFRSLIGRSADRLSLGCEETGLCIRPSRQHNARVLPRGLAHHAASVLCRNPSGLGRAGAIIAGPTAAAAGYTAGSLRKWVRCGTRGMHGAFPRSVGHRGIGSD
jgi:hypothetical protein